MYVMTALRLFSTHMVDFYSPIDMTDEEEINNKNETTAMHCRQAELNNQIRLHYARRCNTWLKN